MLNIGPGHIYNTLLTNHSRISTTQLPLNQRTTTNPTALICLEVYKLMRDIIMGSRKVLNHILVTFRLFFAPNAQDTSRHYAHIALILRKTHKEGVIINKISLEITNALVHLFPPNITYIFYTHPPHHALISPTLRTTPHMTKAAMIIFV